MGNARGQFSWLAVVQSFKSLICQSSQGSTRAGGCITRLLAGLSSLLTVAMGLHALSCWLLLDLGNMSECLCDLATGSLPTEWVIREKYSRQKPHSLLEPDLRGDRSLLLLYAVGHRDQPWYNMKGCHWRPSWRLATTECLSRCPFSMICSSYLMFKWRFYCL